jgi:hypothetical protein
MHKQREQEKLKDHHIIIRMGNPAVWADFLNSLSGNEYYSGIPVLPQTDDAPVATHLKQHEENENNYGKQIEVNLPGIRLHEQSQQKQGMQCDHSGECFRVKLPATADRKYPTVSAGKIEFEKTLHHQIGKNPE